MNVSELIDTSNRLISGRAEWDRVWAQLARMALPMLDREFPSGASATASRDAVEGWAAGPKSVDRLGDRFDTTGIMHADRLTTGLLSLVTPDNEKWMGLGAFDEFGSVEMNDEEVRWSERQRDYLMSTMYSPLCGWSQANKSAMRSAVVFGTGLYLVEEAYGKYGHDDLRVPYTFSTLPLSENFLTVDGQNNIDQDYRRFRLQARQAAQMFGDRVSSKTLAKANDPSQQFDLVDILHWVGYRQEKGRRGDPMRSSLVESVYLEVDQKHELRRGGFNYWPVIARRWSQAERSPYGESPVMLMLSEIKAANILAKNTLLSSQQFTRPPVATSDDGTVPRVNLNPSAINHGALDAQGRLKVQAILTAQSPGLVQEVLQASREQIKEGLYTTLWQVLIQNPNMTASEALIRANEKGELLGPIGSTIQQDLSQCVDAQLTILQGKGAWDDGARMQPPQSLEGRNVRTVFNSPLDRLRRSGELLGVQRTMEMLLPLAGMKPEILDNIDGDEIAKIAQEVNGAPKRMMRKPDQVAEIRDQRNQAQQASDAIAMTGAAGDAAQRAIPGAQMTKQFLDGLNA